MVVTARAATILLAEGRELLSEPEAKALMAACGVPVVGTRVAAPSTDAAVQAAGEVGYVEDKLRLLLRDERSSS